MNFEYSPSLISKLYNIDKAVDAFSQHNGLDLVLNEVRVLFKQHNLTENWGVAILHSHFPMLSSQRLINFGQTTVPIDWNCVREESKKCIHPCSWLFDEEGELRPFEYTHETRKFDMHQPPLAFIKDLHSLLTLHNITSLVGLVQLNLIPKGFEQTHDNANITIPYDIFKEDMKQSSKYDQVVWSFDPISNAKWCQKSCFKGFNNTHDVAHFHWGELRE